MNAKVIVRKFLRHCHLWIALTTGLFVITLSVTGALLIYAKDIQGEINPHYWTVPTRSATMNVDTLIERAEAVKGSPVAAISLEPDRENWAWQFRFQDGEYASVNPYTGSVLLTYAFEDQLYGFLMATHRWLLLRDDGGATPLRDWVSVIAVLLMFEVLVGFVLWVMPKKRLKRLTVRFSAKAKIVIYQLHTVAGVMLFVPLLLISFSGIAFNWKVPTTAVVNTLSPGTIAPRPAPPLIDSGTKPNIDRAVKNGLQALPQAELFRIYLPATPTEPVGLRVKMPQESHAYSWIWSDPYTGDTLPVYDASQTSVATQVWNFKYKFHIGDFAGPVVQVVWLLIALSPVFFLISGVYCWAKRESGRKKK
ncbi:PepSY domain-containing protein [Alteromonas sp. ASW11-19]|uniref:PepSY domain-containing protein n=1 Tax=Alteromonas salexigens TaxID=2982530 RepID=A0ABT2VIP7_9ALTE|nr:PepSY-associated TM helix domain-containing protein [Alteromonas salexigens]MCU7553017.1 PepSY domain-containing protein [Alteromonas salexigens]